MFRQQEISANYYISISSYHDAIGNESGIKQLSSAPSVPHLLLCLALSLWANDNDWFLLSMQTICQHTFFPFRLTHGLFRVVIIRFVSSSTSTWTPFLPAETNLAASFAAFFIASISAASTFAYSPHLLHDWWLQDGVLEKKINIKTMLLPSEL